MRKICDACQEIIWSDNQVPVGKYLTVTNLHSFAWSQKNIVLIGSVYGLSVNGWTKD